MGLLHYATLNYKRFTCPVSGLLQKAIVINGQLSKRKLSSINPFLLFHSFAEENNCNRVGILVPQRNIYTMFFSHGFDFLTIEQSISSIDFWNGTVTDSQWLPVFDDDLSAFYQLFSDEDMSSITQLYLKRFTTPQKLECILLIASDTDESINTDKIDHDIDFFSSSIDSAASLFPIGQFGIPNDTQDDVSIAISNGLSSKDSAYFFYISINSLIDSLSPSLNAPDKLLIYSGIFSVIHNFIKANGICCADKQRKIHCVLFSNNKIDYDLLRNQLLECLSSLFSPDVLSMLTISPVGESSSQQGINEFLFQDN